jgi:hypothetical protein
MAIDVEAETMSTEVGSALLLQDLRNEDSSASDKNIPGDDCTEDCKDSRNVKPISKLRSRFPKKVEGKYLGKVNLDVDEHFEGGVATVQNSIVRSDVGSSSSRVRNKLQAAKDETYFLDEDQFLFS